MRRIALFMSACLLWTPCGGIHAQKGADSTATGIGASRAVEDSSAAKDDPASWTRPVFSYDPQGKRDPFNSLVPGEKPDEQKIKGLFNYEKGTLRGIVNAGNETYALVIDGDNYAHVLRENDPVYGGRVTKITGDAVYLHIVEYGRAMSIVLRMEAERKTVRSGDESEGALRRPGIMVTYGDGASGKNTISVEDVVLPSPAVRTVEESWFGSSLRSGGGLQGAHLLVGPPGGASVQLPQLFRWTKAADDSIYDVIISQDADFSHPVFVRRGLAVPSLLIDAGAGLQDGGTFFWKVTATDRTRNRTDSRNTLSFTIVPETSR